MQINSQGIENFGYFTNIQQFGQFQDTKSLYYHQCDQTTDIINISTWFDHQKDIKKEFWNGFIIMPQAYALQITKQHGTTQETTIYWSPYNDRHVHMQLTTNHRLI